MSKQKELFDFQGKKKRIENPKDWKKCDLGELGKWCGGGTPSKDKPEFWKDGDIPWVSPKDFCSQKLFKSKDLITKLGVENSSTKLVPKGTILCVTRSGILRHRFPVAMAKVDLAINQDLKALIVKDSVDKDFVLQVFLWLEKKLLFMTSKVGTTVESIDFDALKNFLILLPPLPEQKKIAQILSTWDKAIEKTEKLIEAKTKLKKGLMQQLLTGKMRFPEFDRGCGTKPTKVGDIPLDWELFSIEDILEDKKGAIKIGPFGSQLR